MEIDIYQSTLNPSKFLTVAAGSDVTALGVADNDYGKVQAFKMGREANEGDPRVAFDSSAAIAAINSNGYYLHQFVVSNS